MREQFYEQQFHCVMCAKIVPPERVRYKSITCSDECKKARKRSLYVRMSLAQCMFCRKPATKAEQALYRRFRVWMEKNPIEAFPAEYKRWQHEPHEGVVFTATIGMEYLTKMLAEKEDAKDADGAGVSPQVEMGQVEQEGAALQDTPQLGSTGAN